MDPHTYPGRPWPLSTLTRRHTDLYLRKSFQLLEEHLDPDTLFFLGDLFDGGREWLPPNIRVRDSPWSKFGQDYWLQEYNRFGRIYFDRWHQGTQSRKGGRQGRKIIAGLPGNHDLGLGNGIKTAVRKRFNAYFGDGNRIDILGNHTFISLDTVSLSAKGQPDPSTGQEGNADGDDFNRKIWGPTEEFLSVAKAIKERAIAQQVRLQRGLPENEKLPHEVLSIKDPIAHNFIENIVYTSQPDVPSILLTHVPLYRPPGTPCGPLRERFPPSKASSDDEGPLSNDPRNAIRVEQGVQYQNVLTPHVSDEIIDKVGDIEYAFSGDDHDYCEVVHRGYTSRNGGGVREITVKSASWAMGVRRPGFLMVSLWNPLDISPTSEKEGERKGVETMQTHLCLLPDQLKIFIWYGVLFVLTILVLAVRSVVRVCSSSSSSSSTSSSNTPSNLLPTHNKPKRNSPLPSSSSKPGLLQSATSGLGNGNISNGLASRSSAGKQLAARTASPGYAYNTYAYDEQDPLDERWSDSNDDVDKRKRESDDGGLAAVVREFRGSLLRVSVPATLWWLWLVWRRR